MTNPIPTPDPQPLKHGDKFYAAAFRQVPEPLAMDGAARSVRMVAYGKKLYATHGLFHKPGALNQQRPDWDTLSIDVQARYCFVASVLVEQCESDFSAGRLEPLIRIIAADEDPMARIEKAIKFLQEHTADPFL